MVEVAEIVVHEADEPDLVVRPPPPDGGPTANVEAVEVIEMGVTTKTQVQSLLEEPWRTGEEDGLETWTCGHYRYSAIRRSRTRDLVVRFDENGVVISYTYNTAEPP